MRIRSLTFRTLCLVGCLLFTTPGWLVAAPVPSAIATMARHAAPPCFPNPHYLYFCPSQIRAAYGITPLYDRGINGWGRTIVIIAAGVPGRKPGSALRHLDSMLHEYDQMFGLPDTLTRILRPFGGTVLDGAASWEMAIDVETAHMVAPGATIAVVVAPPPRSRYRSSAHPVEEYTADLRQIYRTVRYVVRRNVGDVITLSFGIPEGCVSPSARAQMHGIDQAARQKHITIVAASGDLGAAQLTCGGPRGYKNARAVNLPAADPLVTSVGGTKLWLTADGQYSGEVAWGNTRTSPFEFDSKGSWNGASGGGQSRFFGKPRYQRDIRGLGKDRGIPDVSFVATTPGVPVLFEDHGHVIQYHAEGTSVGAPAWAGIVALADQYVGRRLGFINPDLYRLARSSHYAIAFHDITEGDNNTPVTAPRGRHITVEGYAALKGWDPVTGLGSPKVNALVPLLAESN